MIEEIRQLIVRYIKRGILIDTNILLLYFVGSFNPKLISSFKRTLQFTPEDYNTLILMLAPFERLITTPNILTEVSNLSGQLGEPVRTEYFRTFGKKISVMEENYINSHEASLRGEFIKLGLTDTAILMLATEQYLVLTDDFRLSQNLQRKGLDVINFNHVRPLGWK
jgi:rRNA-processing protein FCF1